MNLLFGMENKPKMLVQRYEVGKLLGQGAFAKVYHARNIKTNQNVAIKVIDKAKVLKGGLIKQIKREISVMRLVKHPKVVQFYEVMATKTKIYYIVEYVKGGELFDKVAKGKLKEDGAQKYFQQLIDAVSFCHSRGVYHRDIKLENLLLDEYDNLKVSDFGLSSIVETKHQEQLLRTTCGTPSYVAPEVINRQAYDGVKADIWSCGVVLFVLLAGYLPFRDSNLMELYRKIGKGEFKYPKGFPLDARRLLSSMLDPNPNTRISMAKIKEDSWFRKGLNLPPIEAEMQEVVKPVTMTAFDIISLSAGFDLSGLFEETCQNKATRFISTQPAEIITSKLEEIATSFGVQVKKKDAGLMKFEELKEGRNGILSMDIEIFEVATCFYLVEMKQSNGDILEYEKVLKDNVRHALHDIVWVWQGEQ